MRTANPALNTKTFTAFKSMDHTRVMTLSGAVNKTFILLALLVLAASFVWRSAFNYQTMAVVTPWMAGGAIGGLLF